MKLLILICALIISLPIFGQDNVVELTIEGKSQEETMEKAKADALQNALKKGCLQVVKDLIGESRASTNKSTIDSKILKNTSKYVQYYKTNDSKESTDDTGTINSVATTVTMKISVTNVRNRLAKLGLLYRSAGPARILPLIKISEAREGGNSFRWWVTDAQSPFLKTQALRVTKYLDEAFWLGNFYMINPIRRQSRRWLPSSYQIEFLSLEDKLWMAEFFNAQIILEGQVELSPGRYPGIVQASIKLKGLNASNGRIVAELSRVFNTGPTGWEIGVRDVLAKSFGEVKNDFSRQIFEEWDKGTFGATLLRVSVLGSMSYENVSNFKDQVSTVPAVKTVKERVIDKKEVVFEIDVSGGLDPLVKKVEKLPFAGYRVTVDKVEGNHLFLKRQSL